MLYGLGKYVTFFFLPSYQDDYIPYPRIEDVSSYIITKISYGFHFHALFIISTMLLLFL